MSRRRANVSRSPRLPLGFLGGEGGPDRLAYWAVLLAAVMIFIAAISS